MRKCNNGVYSDMTETEIMQNRKIYIQDKIRKLKDQLTQSDYKAIKFAEGLLDKEKYETIKAERQRLRSEIKSLSMALKGEI